jgi:hypothetical protein
MLVPCVFTLRANISTKNISLLLNGLRPKGEYSFGASQPLKGGVIGDSTIGATLLDATQWHLGTMVMWRLRRHDARTSGASQPP